MPWDYCSCAFILLFCIWKSRKVINCNKWILIYLFIWVYIQCGKIVSPLVQCWQRFLMWVTVTCDEVALIEGLLYLFYLALPLVLRLLLLSSSLFHISKNKLCLIQRTVAMWIAKMLVRFWVFLFCRVCTSASSWL